MTEIKIGGRSIPLFYSTYEMIAIQQEIGCTAFQLRDEVFGLKQEDEDKADSWKMEVATDPEKAKKFGTLIRILGNAGLEEAGLEPDLTDKWILRHMKPVLINTYALLVMTEIVNGNQMEDTEPAEKKGPRDLILEEENAKKQPGN